ncbi:MFS transporter [Streptomyces sp. NBC_01481]|uniref:MFS transporter n=1 Tax=Streptomyces sp. NBC_01481 TaxID=2975869 RepID=UPI002257CB17|nr:MFS transporter [Streptomyces sp. NBC_01481]MCX4583363.1 MFS transporter [Streptomyces sp. NBC_01481]
MTKSYTLGRYTAGAAAARTGDEMSGPALLLAGLAVTGSAAVASSLLAGIMIAAAVGGPLFGVLLDRSARPGRLLTGALTGYASALVVILIALGRIPIALTVLIAVFAGLLGPALSGGWTSQLPHVVPPEALARANGLDAMTFNAAGLAGPALAGAVAALVGAAAGVIVAAVLICLALPAAWALPVTREREQARIRTPVGTDLTAGFRAILHIRPLARATTVSVISCVGEGMLVACAPLLGQRVLGTAGHGALLLSGIAVSALAANALLARHPELLRPDTVMWCSTLVLAGALLLAATGRPTLLIAAVVLTGIGEGPQLTALFAVRHREAPERLRGQIFTTGASLKLTAFAVGAAIAGPLAVRSLPGALLTAAACQLLAALSCALLWREAEHKGSDGNE